LVQESEYLAFLALFVVIDHAQNREADAEPELTFRKVELKVLVTVIDSRRRSSFIWTSRA